MSSDFVQESKECEVLINTTHGCNLKCKYCFVTDSYYSFEGKSPVLKMSRASQDDCLAFINDYCKPFEHVTLHFYGGEPFSHFSAMKYIAENSASSLENINGKANFYVTTNGTLINKEEAEFLDSMKFTVLVSCDGSPEIHDKMRLTSTGHPTSSKVLETIHLLKSYKNINLGLSAVIYKENNLGEAYKFLSSFSPNFIKAEYIRMKQGHPLDLDKDSREVYFKDLKLIADEVIAQLLNGQTPMDYRFNSRVLQKWRNVRRKEFCGAASSVLGIAANGDIFPCTLLIGQEDCYLGNVSSGIRQEAVKKFKQWHSYKGKLTCDECWAKHYCGGGCAAMWKTVGRGFCEYIKNEVKLAFYIYDSVSKVKPEAFALMVSNEFYEKLNAFINDDPCTFDV